MMDEDSSSFRLSPKNIFLVGLVFGLLIAGTAGFVWTLSGGSTGTKTPPVAINDPTQPNTPTAAAGVVEPVTDKDHVRGDLSKAKVVLVEYSDLECPYCQQFHPVLKQMVQEYGDKVAWVFRNFPLTQLHPKAPKEAEASECANELGGSAKYWAYIDKVYEVTPGNNQLDPAQLPAIAQQVGLDKAKFQNCLDSGKYAAKIQSDIAAAEAAGAQGTPFSVLLAGDQKIPLEGAVPYAQLKSALDQLIK
jgi:protein-disulfide isomerase